jgi:hypothetical protein
MQLYLFSLLTLHVSASCSHLQVVSLLYTIFSTEASAFVMPIGITKAEKAEKLPWRRLYRGGKPPEDGCMKPKHVV